MKATKKIVCLTLAIVMTALAFVMPVSAADSTALVIVDGWSSTPLYKNFGTEDEELIFSADEEFIEGIVKNVGTAFIEGLVGYGLNHKDFEALADSVLPKVNEYFEPIGFNPDGTPMDDTIGFYRTSKPVSEYTEEEKGRLTTFIADTATLYGEDKTYNFTYDWRLDPVEIADELNKFIGEVRVATNSRRVNVVAMSMGSVITLSYLAQYGGRAINNLVFASPAWQGTSLVGNLMTGDLELDIFAVENFLVKSADKSATTHLTAYIISFIATYEGLSHEYFGDINAAIQGLIPYVYSDSFIPYMAGMPALWAMTPAEDYEAAKAHLFADGMDAGLEATTDAYHDIQVNAKSIVEDAMDQGMTFGIVCGYNRQMIPLNTEYEQSDEVIDVRFMTGGATCAKYLQAYDDWAQVYSQQIEDGHNHISWDYKIDASTCMFPEQVWLLKNMSHSDYNKDNGTLDTIIWLLNADEQYTVHTDKENHPQFSLYNTYKRKTTPITIEGIIGDLDESGAVTTADAKIALEIAAGQKEASEYQLIYGDIDEDGDITTADARAILCIAAKIPY